MTSLSAHFPAPEDFTTVMEDLHRQGWSVQKNFWSQAWVDAWREEALAAYEEQLFTQAAIGRAANTLVNTTIRGDSIAWFDERNLLPAQKKYLHAMSVLQQQLNQQLYLGVYEFECHYAIYPPQSFYAKHVDRHAQSQERIVSVISYLNEPWAEADGGALRLYVDDKIKDFYPTPGTLVCFISEGLYHEVLPTQRQRCSITGWFRARHQGVIE